MKTTAHWTLFGAWICGIYFVGKWEMKSIENSERQYDDFAHYQFKRMLAYEGFLLVISGLYCGRYLA